MTIESAKTWAEETFGSANLGDKRRTDRLVKIAENYANNIGASTVSSCGGNEAQIEGAYRFIRSEHVEAREILEAGFESTKNQAQSLNTLLAIEDTTSLSYSHEVSEQLGYTSNNEKGRTQGFEVHSVLLVDFATEKTVGLIEQNWWTRTSDNYGKSSERRSRAYEEKESYKWEESSRKMSAHLEDKMSDVISVCDRESDIYEYLEYKQSNKQRYVIRARTDRCLLDTDEKLYETLLGSPELGRYTVDVKQKGGRKARQAECVLRSAKVSLKVPKHLKNTVSESIEVNAILAEELTKGTKKSERGLQWVLLTTEAVSTFELAREAVRYYELRWRIEDFHKAWKSGVGVEELRHQNKDNLQRAASILTFVAVRLLQMRELIGTTKEARELAKSIKCTELLKETEWKILWLSYYKKKKKIPKTIPSIVWAYQAIAKLGGWYDSKRTGIVGWTAIWEGWFRLQDRVDGFTLCKEAGF